MQRHAPLALHAFDRGGGPGDGPALLPAERLVSVIRMWSGSGDQPAWATA